MAIVAKATPDIIAMFIHACLTLIEKAASFKVATNLEKALLSFGSFEYKYFLKDCTSILVKALAV